MGLNIKKLHHILTGKTFQNFTFSLCDCILENKPLDTEKSIFSCTRKSHLCTIQRYQAFEARWLGLF